jgi:hypothetical protein
MTQRLFTTLFALFAGASAFAAQPAPCTLDPRLLALYDSAATAKPAEFGKLRLTVETFMSNCPRGPLDPLSRKVFFDLVDREYSTDFGVQMAQARGEQESQARWEAITIFQGDLSRYLDEIVGPRDMEYKSTILKVGSGRALAALGPAVKGDVLRLATTAGHKLSGFEHRHNAQAAAFEALGYWIDASNGDFNQREKGQLNGLLTGALDASSGAIEGDAHSRTLIAITRSLGHSDDPRAAASLRRFAERLESKKGEIYESARKSADDVEARSRNKHHG